jgi:PilZ domain-containing protein
VDQPLTDRRIDARFPPPARGATRATLRPGCPVVLVDFSAGGALVEAARPLRPGARVHLQLVTAARTFALAAHVLRCAVWSLDPYDGVTYRGALMFEDRCELVWESEIPGSLAASP